MRSICVAINGEALPPYVPPVQAAPPKKEEVCEQFALFLNSDVLKLQHLYMFSGYYKYMKSATSQQLSIFLCLLI